MRVEVIIILAVIQGITEFLPISSSGHLILLPSLAGTEDQGLAMDVAVHVGSLVAVVGYFRKDVATLFQGAFDLLGAKWTPASRLTVFIGLATVPVLLAGLALKVLDMTDSLRSIEVIGWATIIFGILLYIADKIFQQRKSMEAVTLPHILALGLAQMVALIPGTSRSGITMTAARFLSYERTESARVSMLMSIPTILAAGTLLGVEAAQTEAFAAQWWDLLLGVVLSGVAAYAALFCMMRWLRRATMTPFVIYRMILGLILLSMVYLG